MKKVYPHAVFIDYGYHAREIGTTVKIGPSCAVNTFSPYPKEFIAVWDTGAMSSAITKAIASKLSLRQLGWKTVEGVTGNAVCNTYLIALSLPNGILIPELEVADCEGDIGCDVLIGMDVIGMGDFVICNKDGRTTFSFRTPSMESIDFTGEYLPQHARKTT
jgi:hypothetical protein